jgi:hypothetical protein
VPDKAEYFALSRDQFSRCSLNDLERGAKIKIRNFVRI